MSRTQSKDRLTAIGVTVLVAALVVLVLVFVRLSYDRNLLAQESAPEIGAIEEPAFLDPELLELGEEDAVEQDQPAPSIKGEPEQAEVENTQPVTKGENPKPVPPIEKVITQKQDSPVKAVEPKKTDKEVKKATSKVADSFSGRNGNTDGKADGGGSGGTGIGISGEARGRTFKGCPKPDVKLQNKTTVVVSVTVDEKGNVTSASASGSASASIRRACEKAALQAKWSEKKGATSTRGTITFVITPK